MRPVDHNQYTCPVRSCPWRIAEDTRCPEHRELAIKNPNYGSSGPDRRTLVKS